MRGGSARRFVVILAVVVCLTLGGCGSRRNGGAALLLDGAAFDGGSVSPDAGDDTRVYITLDGEPLIDLPFGEAHTVTIRQADGSENLVSLTGEQVVMTSANCENQDCVNMGAVTRENLELRAMGGFIVCLPHKISVEVRGA